MRFDDRLQTSLSHAADDTISVATRWRQLVDILSQNPRHFPQDVAISGLQQARRLLPHTKMEDRLASVKSLSGRIKSAPLVQLLSADLAPVAAATISGANLSDAEWAAIIPNLPVRARGFLRNRSDLGPKTQRALRYWSAADFALPRPAKVEVSVSSIDIGNGDAKPKLRSEKMRIGEIVERIERLRKDREEQAEIKPTPEPFNLDAINQSEIKEIRFETDEMGTVCWVEGAPRGALVGIGIAEPAFDDSPGPDAYGAAAFRQRMPLENARMRLCGAPAIEGEWRIMATPFFDSNSGRFAAIAGYCGDRMWPKARK